MKKLYTLLLVIAALLSAEKLYSQYASSVTQFPFIMGQKADGAPTCIGGLIYDDGTWENGYGWGPNFGTPGKWVMKFTPPGYPWAMNQFCIALTRLATATEAWTFDIEVWDTTGAGSSPGTLVHSITNQTVTGIPVWPSVLWFDFNNLTEIPVLQSGSYYIGISYDPNIMTQHYVGADESNATPLRPGYGYIQDLGWGTIQSYFPLYRAMGIRVDGEPVFAHDIAAGPFLSLPVQFAINNSYDIKTSVQNVGSSDETGIPVKFFINDTLNNTTNINLSSGAIDSVNNSWTPNVPGTYTLKYVSALANDTNRTNDTVITTVNVLNYIPNPSYCRHGLDVPIHDYQTSFDTMLINIPNALNILDVNVLVDTVIHTWDSDLTFFLIHNDTTVLLINRRGGHGDNFIGTYLNDSATTPISYGQAPFTGSFSPDSALAKLKGHNVNGLWILSISDDAPGDTGTLKAWCLDLVYYTLVGGIQNARIPNFYSLQQNYPNPFNPVTKITYTIPKTGNVQLKVYDIQGREVASLVNEVKQPGVYTVDFDASSLSSGVYFYKIESGSFTDTKKMLLIK